MTRILRLPNSGHTPAPPAQLNFFQLPKGWLFEQNFDFSNSAQGYVDPLCVLCGSSEAGGEKMLSYFLLTAHSFRPVCSLYEPNKLYKPNKHDILFLLAAISYEL